MIKVPGASHAGIITAGEKVDGQLGIGTVPSFSIETILHHGEEVRKTVGGEGELAERVVFICLQ